MLYYLQHQSSHVVKSDCFFLSSINPWKSALTELSSVSSKSCCYSVLMSCTAVVLRLYSVLGARMWWFVLALCSDMTQLRFSTRDVSRDNVVLLLLLLLLLCQERVTGLSWLHALSARLSVYLHRPRGLDAWRRRCVLFLNNKGPTIWLLCLCHCRWSAMQEKLGDLLLCVRKVQLQRKRCCDWSHTWSGVWHFKVRW